MASATWRTVRNLDIIKMRSRLDNLRFESGDPTLTLFEFADVLEIGAGLIIEPALPGTLSKDVGDLLGLLDRECEFSGSH